MSCVLCGSVAAGRTRYNEIEQAVGASPSRVIDNLIELRLLERSAPVTERQRHTRRKSYRIGDNFLASWLGVVSKYRAEIDRGLGKTVLPVSLASWTTSWGRAGRARSGST